jgi:probable rRNA maturation factor
MASIQLQINHSVKVSKKLRLWLELASHVAAEILPAKVKISHLNLLLCGDQRIKTINREFRKKDKVTDVLSFPAQSSLRDLKNIDWIQPGELSLGDLVISLPQAQRQARQFKLRLEEEVVHLYFHGFLHLLGYDHELSAKEEKMMEALEAKLLDRFAKKRAS